MLVFIFLSNRKECLRSAALDCKGIPVHFFFLPVDVGF